MDPQLLDSFTKHVYTYIMDRETPAPIETSFPGLPCACANLRRAARAVTRMYNQELRSTGLELTQYTLLMALSLTGETTQGELGRLLALDTTSLTRMLRFLKKRQWIAVQSGHDRRQRLLRLTPAGRRKLQQSEPRWKRSQDRLRKGLGQSTWDQMGKVLAEVTRVSAEQ